MIDGILLFLAGLALFLFAMMKLGGLVQELLSARIRDYLLFAVKTPFHGLGTGIAATILFQSSSATTLLTVGMVSAGLMSFASSLGIILGSDIGTTLTVQLVVWKVTDISPLIIFAGGMFWFAGKERWRSFGEGLLYFGLIFYGLALAGSSTAPLKNYPAVLEFFRGATNPFAGLAAGIVFTAIVHASSIPVSILVLLAAQGLVTIEVALPIVLGANVGTTVTAAFGGIVANAEGRRSALAHVLLKCFGAAILLLLLPFVIGGLKGLTTNVPQQITLGHFFLNLIIVIVFLPFLKPFSRLVARLIPGREESVPLWPEFLDKACLARTDDALLCVQKELKREIALARRMLVASLELIEEYREQRRRDVMYIEMVVDNLQLEITRYLWNISCNDLTPALSKRLFAFSGIVYDIERIADRSTNLVELAESRHKRRALFSEQGRREIREIGALVLRSVDGASALLDETNAVKIGEMARRTVEIERLIRQSTERHLERFYQRVCRAEAGPIFVDMLINLERISEHCKLIADHVSSMGDDGAGHPT